MIVQAENVGMNQYKIKEGLSVQELIDSIPQTAFDTSFKYNSSHVQAATNRISIREAVKRPLKLKEVFTHYKYPQSCFMEVYNTPVFKQSAAIRGFLGWFHKTYGGQHYRSAIAILPPGKSVQQHIDGGPYYSDKDRFHLVLQGNYEYTVAGESREWKAGDLFWFDNKKEHSSISTGKVDRMAFIFDVQGSRWRDECGIK